MLQVCRLQPHGFPQKRLYHSTGTLAEHEMHQYRMPASRPPYSAVLFHRYSIELWACRRLIAQSTVVDDCPHLVPCSPFRRACCFADFTVDMQRKRIQGVCKLHVTALKAATEGVAELVLDTRSLLIHCIDLYENADGNPVGPEGLEATDSNQIRSKKATELKWKLSASDPVLGEALNVFCPGLREAGSKVVVKVKYEVTEASSAVQFLAPELTASKKYPFLFTQCQAIHARSLCPCQVPLLFLISYSVLLTFSKESSLSCLCLVPHSGKEVPL